MPNPTLKETAHYIVVREVRSDPEGTGTGSEWQMAIQQVVVKDPNTWEGIRFAYYKDGNLVARPPVFDHGVVLKTISRAIQAGILCGISVSDTASVAN